MAGTKPYTGKSGTPGVSSPSIGSTSKMTKQADLGEMEPVAASEGVSVKKMFGNMPEEYRDAVNTFMKRNGQNIAATEENYSKLARVAGKVLEDGRQNGIRFEESRVGLGKGTAWDGADGQYMSRGAIKNNADATDAGEQDVGIGASSAMRTPEEVQEDLRRVFGDDSIPEADQADDLFGDDIDNEKIKGAVKEAASDGSSVWTKLRKMIWTSREERDRDEADNRNKQNPGDTDFDWNEYTPEMHKIKEIETSNMGLNLFGGAGTTGVKIGNAILGFLHEFGRGFLKKGGEYDTPDDVYVNSDRRLDLQKKIDKSGNFFANKSKKPFQYDFSHINRKVTVDEEGNRQVVVYDADNHDFPNAYPEVEAEFAARMADMGLNANVIVDVGAYTESGNRDLYWEGRELLLAMADFDPKLLSGMKSVRLMTRSQFAKAMNENSPNHDVFDKELLDGRKSAYVDGHLIVFIDPTNETQETHLSGRLDPPPEELRNLYHQVLSGVVMSNATPEFREEWEKVSLLKENKDGLFAVDKNDIGTVVDAFSGIADVEKELSPKARDALTALFTGGALNRDQEMAAAIEMYKNARLPEILFKLKHDNPAAYAYLTRMLAVVDRFEEQLAPSPGLSGKAKARPKPEAAVVDVAKAQEIAAQVDALAKMAKELAEKGVKLEDATPPQAPTPPSTPNASPQAPAQPAAPSAPNASPQKPTQPVVPPESKKPTVFDVVGKPNAPDSQKPVGGKTASKSSKGAIKVNSTINKLSGFGAASQRKLADLGVHTLGDLVEAVVGGNKDVEALALGSPSKKNGQSRRKVVWEAVQDAYNATAEEAAIMLGLPYDGKGKDATLVF